MDYKLFKFTLFIILIFLHQSFAKDSSLRDSVTKIEIPSVDTLGQTEQEEISQFREKFSLRFLCNYNFISIDNSTIDEYILNSNRPIDLGLGFGYDSLFTLFGVSWDFSWDFTFVLPFTASNGNDKTAAFETNFNFFPGNWWLEGRFRYYEGFSSSENAKVSFDLTLVNIYFSALWLATANKKFSIRSAYFLDRKQRFSAGSLIIGAREERDIAIDEDKVFGYEDNKRDLTITWIDMGYTYTWIFKNHLFMNCLGLLGMAYGFDSEATGYALLPEVDGRFVFGYMKNKWAWNNTLRFKYNTFLYGSNKESKYISSFEILVVRRI